jgi:hypothetical protein
MKSQTTKTAEPIARDETQILADIDAQLAEHAFAEGEADKLRARRREALAHATPGDILNVDREIAHAATVAEISKAKIDSLEAELEALHAARREARIAADMARAQALAERERALIAAYATAAREAAEALVELGPIHRELSALNLTLPTRIEAVGTHLVHAVKLPGIATDGPDHWPPSPRVVYGPVR